jgi:outer membrane protein
MKQNRIRCLFSTILLCLSMHVMAQDSSKLSLQQAIDMCIRNSHLLKISAAKMDDAKASLQAAKDAQLPNFSLSANYLRLGFAKIDLNKANNTSGNQGASKSPSQAMYGIANVSLPLYAGNRIHYGIEAASLLEKAASSDGKTDKQSVILYGTNAFVNLYKLQEWVSMVKEQLASDLVRDSSLVSLEKNGVITRNDLLKSQLQTSSVELSLLEAENNRHLAEINMNLMMGRAQDRVITIDSDFLNDKEEIKDFEEYETLAFKNRNELQAIANRKNAALLGIKSAKAEAYPTIGLSGGYVSANVPDVLTITNAVNIGVGVQYNVSNLWKKNTQLMKAKARETQVLATEGIWIDSIKMQLNRDYQNYLLSKKKTSLYEKARDQATENFRIINNKYNNNLATISDLLEANVALLLSRLNLKAANADSFLAYQKLQHTAGLSHY